MDALARTVKCRRIPPTDRAPTPSRREHMSRLITVALAVGVIAALAGVTTAGAVTYEHIDEYDAHTYPTGLAVDQSSGDLYVANLINLDRPGLRGELQRIGEDESSTLFGDGYYPAVAVDPVDGDVYTIDFGEEMEMIELGRASYVWDPFGYDRRIIAYDSSGSLKEEPSIPITADLTVPVRPQLAVDHKGHIYYPNIATDRVEVYNRQGKLAKTITGSSADGSVLSNPSQIAVGPNDTLYVVDGVKMVDDGTGYLVPNFDDARLQRFDVDGNRIGSGPMVSERVKSIGVNPANGRVFVGRAGVYEPGDPRALYDSDYHLEAYYGGHEVAQFGYGYYTYSQGGPGIAVSARTGKVFVSDEGTQEVEVYARR
jgi:DNA-binding beta-propeller fold protein YncE